jgi:hypothetical protein
VTWRGGLRRARALEQAGWGQQKAKDPEVADKNERGGAERWPLFDEGTLESWRSDSMELGRRKYVGGWSGKVDVVDQDSKVVLVLVFGDGESLERDVAAANKWARGRDRDWLHFLRRLLC